MNGRSAIVCVALACALGGCQRRTITVTSEPSGALAYLNDVEVGRTPVEVEFTWFGTYAVRLEKEGYETLETSAEAQAPLHEEPVFDLIFMAIPGEDRTEIAWHFELTPETRDPEGLIERAEALRERFEPRAEPAGEASDGD